MAARTVDIVRAELEPVAEEAEARSAVERRVPTIGKLVARSVDPEIVVILEAFRVRQEHDPDAESIEAELAGRHHFARTADGTSGVQLAELAGNDKDVVVLLLLAHDLEHVGRLLGLPEVLGIDLTVAVVLEPALALRLEQVQNLLDRLGVGRCDLLPPRNGKPSLGALGEWLLGQLLVGVADTREQFPEAVGLLGDVLGLVARGVAVVGLDLLVGELVGGGMTFQSLTKACLEVSTILDKTLSVLIVEAGLVQNRLKQTDNVQPLRISRCDQCLGRHRHHPL